MSPHPVLQFQRHLFVHISQQCPSPGAPPLESVDVRQIYDKFPEKKGGLRELYDRGPPHAFFLVKFWVSAPKSWLYQSGTRRVLGLPGPPFRVKTNTVTVGFCFILYSLLFEGPATQLPINHTRSIIYECLTLAWFIFSQLF